MKLGRFPIYPIIAALYPVVLLYSVNWGIVPLSDIVVPLLVAFVSSCAAFVVVWVLMRDLHRTAVVVTLAVAATYTFAALLKITGIDDRVLLFVEVLALFVIGALLTHKKVKLQGLSGPLNLLTIILLLLPVIGLATGEKRQVGTRLPVKIKTDPSAAPARKPDIFYIVVDGYGRADQLKRVMGFDNSDFIDFLTSRGFHVIPKAHSNYCQTELSISSTLNISYLQDFRDKLTPLTQDRLILDDSINKSFVAEFFRSIGYRIIGVASGFPNITFKNADAVYKGAQSRSLLQNALLEMTPLASKALAPESMFNVRRKTLNAAFENLVHLAKPSPAPRLVLAHILAPHPPFVFDRDGNPLRQATPFGYADGSDYMEIGGTPQSYTDGYTGQIQYENQRLKQVVDAILKQATSPPIIIIAGDHGSKQGLDQQRIEKTDVQECFSNLQALYLPPNAEKLLTPDFTPINFFRLILKECFNQPIELVPNHSYYSPFPGPYQFTEVTDRLK